MLLMKLLQGPLAISSAGLPDFALLVIFNSGASTIFSMLGTYPPVLWGIVHLKHEVFLVPEMG